MQEEVEQRIVSLMISCGKLSADKETLTRLLAQTKHKQQDMEL